MNTNDAKVQYEILEEINKFLYWGYDEKSDQDYDEPILKDIDFPNGESTKNVSLRVKNFILFLMKFDLNKKKYLIVTHNVFLRCLIGKYFDVPMHKWHLLKINYGENINFKLIEKKLFINITRNKFKKIFKNIYENSIST